MRRIAILFLLLCASTHCILSLFYVNTSYLDLHRYAQGTERQPFQRRILMVPLLRWAEANPMLESAAARYGAYVPQPEPMSAAKLACLLVSLLAFNAFGLYTLRVSRSLSIRHDWLLWTFLLVILYASYSARYEQALWYPYDIPHLVLFGLATVFILSDRPIPLLAAFVLDALTRETSIFLVVLALAVHFRSRIWRVAATIAAFLWLLVHILAQHLYPHGAHEWNGLHWYTMLRPQHLPQLFSIVGFLWLPVWLGVKRLDAPHRRALYAATTMMFFTFFFATWNETRAWSEWIVLFAILAALQMERAFAAPHESPPALASK